MKVTIEYNLPEDADIYKASLNLLEYRNTLSDLYTELRSKIKYESDSMSKTEQDVYHEIHDKFFEMLKANDLDLNDII